MAPQPRRKDSQRSNPSSWGRTCSALNLTVSVIDRFSRHPLSRCIELLMLAAASTSISQLCLSPVYGSIPASLHHQKLIISAILLAYAIKFWYQKELAKRLDRRTTYIPVVALVAPPLQSLLFKQSSLLGPLYGPLITETCTYIPIVFLSILSAAIDFDRVGLSRLGKTMHAATSIVLISMAFLFLQKFIIEWMTGYFGRAPIYSRAGIQYAIAAIYVLRFPSRKLYIWGLFLSIPLSTNFHMPLQARITALNETLLGHGYSLLARNESLTGYISVLDNIKDGFRVMRCDHSLLGGEWRHTPKHYRLREPIYAIFTMLEAIRLVEPEVAQISSIIDLEKHALVMYVMFMTFRSQHWLICV